MTAGSLFFIGPIATPPGWRAAAATPGYPVVIDDNPSEAKSLRLEIDPDAKSRVRYLGLNTSLGGHPYQVIARLTYVDALHSRLHSITGFTVNMAWVRQAYFADLFSQVTPIATRGIGLTVAVADEKGQQVWGPRDVPWEESVSFRFCSSIRR